MWEKGLKGRGRRGRGRGEVKVEWEGERGGLGKGEEEEQRQRKGIMGVCNLVTNPKSDPRLLSYYTATLAPVYNMDFSFLQVHLAVPQKLRRDKCPLEGILSCQLQQTSSSSLANSSGVTRIKTNQSVFRECLPHTPLHCYQINSAYTPVFLCI